MGMSFRSSAGFGKRMKYNIVGQMLMEGLDCFKLPDEVCQPESDSPGRT